MLSVGLCSQIACIWEASARKPGNVHRFCDFDDSSYVDFLLSAAAMAPILETAAERGVGATVLAGVQATRQVVATNTNLGILLLLAPLATVPRDRDLRSGLTSVLGSLAVDDSREAYEAIRLAAPAGLGTAPAHDITQTPTLPLAQIMALAADRDLIARQYSNGFREVFEEGLPALVNRLSGSRDLETAIIACHLHLLSRIADTLIVRKRGRAEAEEASRRAAAVLDHGWPETVSGREALAGLDAWLRAEGHARNPGATADLVAACLFVALREGLIQLPRTFTATGITSVDHG
jgi:triphosphoribosyl-dephospho-CoA synthase